MCKPQRRDRAAKEASGEDRTAIELFVAGVRSWEVGLRQQVEGG
jgi:hypothetical protein